MAGELCEDKSRRMISSAGFCYSDVSSGNQTIQSHMENQIQGFDSNSEIFNSTAGIEMIGFSRNQQQNTDGWKGFLGKAISQPGPSRMMNESTGDYYFTKPDFTASGGSEGSRENNFMATAAWQENRLLVDESNSFRCVFPCEGNERPSQGLSLSLSSSNPSSIALQSFELRQAHHQGQHDDHTVRFDTASTSRDIQQQQHMMQGGPMSRSSNFYHHGQFQLRDSKYLSPAQELLNEFCSLGIKYNDPPKQKADKSKLSDQDEEHGSSSSFRRQPLHTLDFMELQKRKAKLLSMLEEVDKRYRHYRDQMKAVASSFESVAGTGSASVYTALASKAMSKHFRCLRDAIVDQIQAIKKAMGDKDQAVPGTSRGETPRLRALDQVFRQQRAMQQMSMLESHPWRPQRGLPERSVSILRAWLFEHFLHPYPTDVDKHILARQTGLSRSQVSNWFINARVRLWKPMVEEMYIEEFKEQENASSSGKAQDEEGQPPRENPHDQDQKPSQEQLVQIDSQCLSSIIPQKNDDRNNKTISQNHNNMHSQQNQSFGRVGETFGVIDLDFSSYNNQNPGGTVSYTNDQSVNHNFNGGGNGGVSLTLGLQQQGGNIAFSPTSQSSLFYSRDHIEDCQPVQYSLLDGEGQNLPYRNLMGAQILHDLA